MCSFSLSKALVASSRSSTLGSRMTARAMATRCFWPPEIRAARSPGWVLYPSFRLRMKSSAFAIFAAAATSSDDLPSAEPYAMLSLMGLSKRTGSCSTKPT
mmetsp:Transcript_32858/g.102595  ORF Transcript_32858/g.102595 Transcript_32858/m.102595 type:complete len:101 (+) Transcript_32858:394-696(+)